MYRHDVSSGHNLQIIFNLTTRKASWSRTGDWSLFSKSRLMHGPSLNEVSLIFNGFNIKQQSLKYPICVWCLTSKVAIMKTELQNEQGYTIFLWRYLKFRPDVLFFSGGIWHSLRRIKLQRQGDVDEKLCRFVTNIWYIIIYKIYNCIQHKKLVSAITPAVTNITVVDQFSDQNFDLVMWITISTSERCLECWTVIDVIYVFTREKISHVKFKHEYSWMHSNVPENVQQTGQCQQVLVKFFLFLSFFLFFQLVLVGVRKDV